MLSLPDWLVSDLSIWMDLEVSTFFQERLEKDAPLRLFVMELAFVLLLDLDRDF